MPKYKNNRNPFTQISKYKHFVLELFFFYFIYCPISPHPIPALKKNERLREKSVYIIHNKIKKLLQHKM